MACDDCGVLCSAIDIHAKDNFKAIVDRRSRRRPSPLLLNPAATVLVGLPFSLINSEIASGHPNYVRKGLAHPPLGVSRTASTDGSFVPQAKAAQECVCVTAEPSAERQLLQFLTISAT